MSVRIKKNDTVVVITGRDKGKKGRVLAIERKKNKVMVEGVALMVRHIKARKAGDVSGVKESESFIHLSNVMPLDESTGKPVRG